MRKNIVGALVLAVGLTGSYLVYADSTPKIADLQQQIATLQTQNSVLQWQSTAYQLNTQLNACKQQVAELQKKETKTK